MRVLITGGAGFIGHNLSLYLRKRGHEVVVFDNLKRAAKFAIDLLRSAEIEVVKGDILNPNLLKEVLRDIDVVIHAAAYINVEESFRKPVMYFKNNVIGTLNVSRACLDNGVDLLIYLSSAAVYGQPDSLPIKENHPTRPLSPYGLSKLMGEMVVEHYARMGLNYAILRLFNVYGPGQSEHYAGVITRFIRNALAGKPLEIYGDGTQTRDFIHVLDVSKAILLTVERGLSGELLNIGTGRPVKIIELARNIVELIGRDLRISFLEPREGDIKHSYADITKAERLIGFKPTISLEEGIQNMINTIKAERHL